MIERTYLSISIREISIFESEIHIFAKLIHTARNWQVQQKFRMVANDTVLLRIRRKCRTIANDGRSALYFFGQNVLFTIRKPSKKFRSQKLYIPKRVYIIYHLVYFN